MLWALTIVSGICLRSFTLLCLRLYGNRNLFSSWVKYNPRRIESDVRRVTFDNLQNSVNHLSGTRRFEILWFCYSLAMPAYEKSVAILDTFDDKYVLSQEFEHSRVHAKLNDSYEKSLSDDPNTMKLIQVFKSFWRFYFGFVMSSFFKDIMIFGEIKLGFNCFDVEPRLQMMKNAPMSDDMRKVLVYHDLEEIEHGLDLVPKLSKYSLGWKLILITIYNIHEAFMEFMFDLHILLIQFRYKPLLSMKRNIPPMISYIVNPFQHVNPRVTYAVLMNRYPTREERNRKESSYLHHAKELHDMDLNQRKIII